MCTHTVCPHIVETHSTEVSVSEVLSGSATQSPLQICAHLIPLALPSLPPFAACSFLPLWLLLFSHSSALSSPFILHGHMWRVPFPNRDILHWFLLFQTCIIAHFIMLCFPYTLVCFIYELTVPSQWQSLQTVRGQDSAWHFPNIFFRAQKGRELGCFL